MLLRVPNPHRSSRSVSLEDGWDVIGNYLHTGKKHHVFAAFRKAIDIDFRLFWCTPKNVHPVLIGSMHGKFLYIYIRINQM